MKTLILVSAVLFFTGCKAGVVEDWQAAPRQYVCTTEQMVKAESEADWCNKHTSFFSEYCYGTAIMRNCVKKKFEGLL
jgi:hypothetical protein